MRLRLFDRIRRLAHRRRPENETAPGVQGRHRRAQGSAAEAPLGRSIPADPATSPGPSRSASPAGDFAPAGEGWPTRAAESDWPAPAGTGLGRPGTGPPRLGGRRPTGGLPLAPGRACRGGAGAHPRGTTGAGDVASAPASPGLSGSRPHGHQATRPGPAHAAGPAGGYAGRAARPRGGRRSASARRTRPDVLAGGRSGPADQAAFHGAACAERPSTADGRRNCGSIERILWRQWTRRPHRPPR